jgi:hypothetical protein
MLETLSILLALLIGFLLVRAFDPVGSMQPRWAAILFDAALGAGVGMGFTSIVFLLLDVTGAATPGAIFGIDIALVGVLAWQWFRTRGAHPAPSISTGTASRFRWTWLLALAFGIVLAISWTRLVQILTALPVGNWDAWTLWNLRAKFLAGPGSSWRFAVSPLIDDTHPDYPLLLSAFIARVWKAGGAMDAMAPVATALVFFAALLALLVSAVALLRSTASALLAGLVILSTTSLLVWAPAQYADIPIAFYYLGAMALLFVDASPAAGGHRALFWAGLCAGLAAWTKNEGIAFLVCLFAVFIAFTLRRQGVQATLIGARTLLAGAAPGILLTLWLKFFLAPAADPLLNGGLSGLARLKDLSRYAEVASGLFRETINLGSGISHPLILMAILAVVLRWQIENPYRTPVLIAAVSLSLVFLSYCAVYLITPSGVAWEVQSSLARLILQIWPGILLVFFLVLSKVADVQAPMAAVKAGIAVKSAQRSGKKGK